MQGDHPPKGEASVFPLWPPGPPEALEGLYLGHDLRGMGRAASKPLVYSNFVTSLDGRIALQEGGVPSALANPRDWWLFQELAIQADAIMVSGRYMRARARNAGQDLFVAFHDPCFAELRSWRHAQGLPDWPWIVVLSRRLDCPIPSDVPIERLLFLSGDVACASPQALALRQAGAVVKSAGKQKDVSIASAITRLSDLGVRTIYAVGGAAMLHMLVAGGVLSRLYLTRVHRLLGGDAFTSLVEGGELSPFIDLKLHRLYYDPAGPGAGGQLFGCYHTAESDG